MVIFPRPSGYSYFSLDNLLIYVKFDPKIEFLLLIPKDEVDLWWDYEKEGIRMTYRNSETSQGWITWFGKENRLERLTEMVKAYQKLHEISH